MQRKISDPDEYPAIEIIEDKLVISITQQQLRFTIDNHPEGYRVVKPDELLEAFAKQLHRYQSSNAKELGVNELQVLFDRIVQEVCESGEDVIIETTF